LLLMPVRPVRGLRPLSRVGVAARGEVCRSWLISDSARGSGCARAGSARSWISAPLMRG